MKTSLIRFASLLALASAALAAQAVTITFDEGGPAPAYFDSTTPLRDEYAALGVFFTGPDALGGGSILDQSSNFGVPAYSGRNFLAFNNTRNGIGGFANSPETITFASLQTSVSLYVAQSFFTLVAFDASGNRIDFSAATATGSYELLSVSGTGIKSVVLTAEGGGVADDLTFEAAPPAVPGPMAALPFALMALKRRKRA